METKKNVIRSLRAPFANDDYYALGTLLLKAGYTVRLTSQAVPGKQTKEKVVLYWEEGKNG